MRTMLASLISSISSLSDAVSLLGFLMAAINRFVSTKNRRMLFPDLFFDVTSHPANYCIDVDFLEVFLKLFRQFFDVYFFDDQEVVFTSAMSSLAPSFNFSLFRIVPGITILPALSMFTISILYHYGILVY